MLSHSSICYHVTPHPPRANLREYKVLKNIFLTNKDKNLLRSMSLPDVIELNHFGISFEDNLQNRRYQI